MALNKKLVGQFDLKFGQQITLCKIFFLVPEHFTDEIRLFLCYHVMSTTRKIAIGLSLASGALLATWLLSSEKGKKAKRYIVRKAIDFKKHRRAEIKPFDDSEIHYI